MKNPKFSVIIGMYNQLQYLPRLIESLNNQSFKDFEVIFCDDKSRDGTKEFFHAGPEFQFEAKYKRPFFKKYLSGSMNMGIKEAKGDYCVFIMGDSFPETNYLELLNDHVNEETIVCGIRVQVDGERAVDVDWRIAKQSIPQHEAILTNEPFNALTGNGLTIPRSALIKYGGWDEHIKKYGGDDNLLIGKFYFKGYLCKSVPQLVLYHNWHKGQETPEDTSKYCEKVLTELYYGR